MAPLVALALVGLVGAVLVARSPGTAPAPTGELTVGELTEPAISQTPAADATRRLEGSWTPMAPGPLAGRVGAAVAAAGDSVLIWGGVGATGLTDGALYDPDADTWRLIAKAPLSPRYAAAAAWDGREVAILGGIPVSDRPQRSPARRRDAAAYHPATDSWRALPPLPFDVVAGRVFASGGRLYAVSSSPQRRPVAVLESGSAMWRLLPAPPQTGPGDQTAVTLVEGSLLVWPASRGDGVLLDLTTRRWSVVTRSAPLPRGSRCDCVVLGGVTPTGGTDVVVLDGQRRMWWRPALPTVQPSRAVATESLLYLVVSPAAPRAVDRTTGQLLTLPSPPRALAFQPAAVVIAGDRLLLWGGASGLRRRFTVDGLVFRPSSRPD